MNAFIQRLSPFAETRLNHLLDASFAIGRQYGRPVEVTVRDALREAPRFLALAGLIGFFVFL